MRKALDALYRLSAALAALCLVVIAVMVVAQVAARIFDGARSLIGLEPLGLLVPSLAEIAGFLLVGASFLALASTLRNADHIRVIILLQMVPRSVARFLELWVLAVAVALIGYFAWNAALLTLDSYQFNEVSFGIIPVPLWIPQAAMTAGLAVFLISLIDDLVVTLLGGEPSYMEPMPDHDLVEGTE
ncbi:TRAP-type C4-dicarboxylate transport system permease small subunit [Breoghania corrubedonensis]|uniref:TRAP transporter small permease protein n=1 Tax=Breoghania corrubedonensis TaxID=665038 RepID=A0A2T5V514_9HYPH|nr:TRAP transporter small permease [Breoghania corrubedonensis]PTW58823.1 TRAP-type C4-dicarboxylate transport system permease small subunit [Breoghania corrubedonensis]